ncbi:MAG: 3-methyl-2-oxobutanoate hydroxymethyltransferase [Clostridia bacterium]|nr:MAG: 3-methyl-2-oxobutanoate hydroxymethyltransferase [Clostridia bacterium]
MPKDKLTIPDFMRLKKEGRKITMLTAYDYPTALMVEEAGLDMILVGDSLGMTVLGLESTIPVTMEDMLHHTKAVTRAVRNTFVVADLPFMAYNISREQAIANCGILIKEGGADAVKLEGGNPWVVETVRAVVEAGIPVMAHLGLTPQTATQLGGYRVQGKDSDDARRITGQAEALAEAGAFSLVLECVPASLGAEITKALLIPTIGIGAGPDCDGQVLVFHDLVGLFEKFVPKFVKRYANVREIIVHAMAEYAEEVRTGAFPDAQHSFK